MTEEQVEQPDDDGSWLDVPAGGDDGGISMQGGEVQATEPPSEYAVKNDQWGHRRGRDLLEEGGFKELGVTEFDAADAYAMAFQMQPELLEQCANEEKKQFFETMMNSSAYQELHIDTQLDVSASEIASLHFSQQWVKLVKEREKQQEQQQKQQQQNPNAKPDPHADLKKEMQELAAARSACQQAQKDVNELNDTREALGIGKGEGGGGGMDAKTVKQVFQSIKNNSNLKRICDLAGKYRLMARAKQRQKVVHGQDDMVGVELGNDIGKLLPHEMAMLAHPVLKFDALRRFTERGMMQRAYKGVQTVAKGPIIVLIDESGSMSGEKICQAKALALTMAWIARQQNRWCGLVGWSSRGQTRFLALPPNKWPTAEVMKWLTNFLNGGTHIPVEQLPDIYSKLGAAKGKTDMFFITDGDVPPIDKSILPKFLEWKKEVKAKIVTLSIQIDALAFKPISEEYYLIDKLHVNNSAVGEVLSV